MTVDFSKFGFANCECRDWCRDFSIPDIEGHHPNCDKVARRRKKLYPEPPKPLEWHYGELAWGSRPNEYDVADYLKNVGLIDNPMEFEVGPTEIVFYFECFGQTLHRNITVSLGRKTFCTCCGPQFYDFEWSW